MPDARTWTLLGLAACALLLLFALLLLRARRRARPRPPIAFVPARDVPDEAWERARTIPTQRGDKVRSWGEARIADWLHARGIRYEYEPLVAGRRPDFLLPDLNVLVEYSGVKDEKYRRRHEERLRAYAREDIRVISLQGERWREVESALDEGLRRAGWRPPRA